MLNAARVQRPDDVTVDLGIASIWSATERADLEAFLDSATELKARPLLSKNAQQVPTVISRGGRS